MIPFLGNFSLWLALIFSILQSSISFKKKFFFDIKLNKIVNYGLLISSLVSFFSLVYCYVTSDFSVSNVFENSHTSKPLFYKISAVWGNHEGSMLLWILVLCIFNFFIFKFFGKKDSNIIFKTLETQGLIIVGFILFTIFTSNPFEIIDPIPENGLGFNPILQDPALAIHPPLLYIGYVGLSAAFSISVATLCENPNDIGKTQWYNYMKPFVLASWSFLTIGIALGSIWAYYELGWGGWWFWDPVENASFMPWLLCTALLHSLIIVEKKKSLKAWVLLLAILSFILSMIGTFLVRSGILTSVHTFALDPSRGIYILLFVAILGSYSLLLFGKNSKNHFNNNFFSFFSKEGSILVNNILMVVVCGTVFLGTIYPLVIEALTNNKISVGEPYFNSTVIPIAIPAILIMGMGPILSWKKDDKLKVFKKISPNILITLLVTTLVFFIVKSFSFIGFIGILLGFWIIFNNLTILFEKVKKYSSGMLIAHLGVGFLILGMTGSSVWQEEKVVRMKINSDTKIKNYRIFFSSINEIQGKNYVAIRGDFLVYEKEKLILKLNPENRFYLVKSSFTSEASIHTNLLRDLYIVLGEGNVKNGWVVKIYHNPLVIWIWIGFLMIFIGGITSLNTNLKKLKL